MNLRFCAHGCAYKTDPASARQKAFPDTLSAGKGYLGRVRQRSLEPTKINGAPHLPQKPESSGQNKSANRMDALTKPIRPARAKRRFRIRFPPGKGIWGACDRGCLNPQKLMAHHTYHRSQNLPDKTNQLTAWMRLQNRPGQRAPKGVSGYAFRRERVSGARAPKAAWSSKTNQRTKYSTTASILRIKINQLSAGYEISLALILNRLFKI
ncbi:hypothetical protein [Vibrio quintilis]|uniref:Uncharacterized protein n=1 Tax=Vibrio quintilis TaxID=1117707 RepID=A0A1M7YW21_9VIBR|nr:hypothetical protein [Vibrio quintilis]SHO56763.1 hypothetical protein VQ7734_02532 [Vibrio quintilis]